MIYLRVTFLSFALAISSITCNAYATHNGIVNRKNVKRREHTTNTFAMSSAVSDIRRFFPTEKKETEIGRSEQVALAGDASSTGEKVSVAKISGIVLSSLAVLLMITSSSWRSAVVDFFPNALSSYKNAMVRFPLETKVATGASLAVLGDALAQSREPTGNDYDPRRAASFAAFDSCYRFFQHNAFPHIISICQGGFIGGILSSFPGIAVKGNLRLGLAALERTLVYQLLVIPLLYYPIFFTFTGYLQGLELKEIVERAKQNFFPCWRKNLQFWIPTQMIMFGLIDEKWQIPFACIMGMMWSTILSVTAGNAKKAASP